MFNRISKMLTIAGISLAVAIGSISATTTPAQADNEDLRRLLGGAAALFVLGAIINEHNDRRQPSYHGGHAYPRPHPQPQLNFFAPSNCYHMFRGPHGNQRAFGAHCMRTHSRQAHLLPAACVDRIFTYQGWRQVYDAQCLRRHGWSRQ